MSDSYWDKIAKDAERARAEKARASAKLNGKWRPKKKLRSRRRAWATKT